MSCRYNTNMQAFDEALMRPLNLQTTRSDADPDAYRDMDGFDVDEELARLRRAVAEAEGVTASEAPTLFGFITEAFANVDEHLRRLGRTPDAWVGDSQQG